MNVRSKFFYIIVGFALGFILSLIGSTLDDVWYDIEFLTALGDFNHYILSIAFGVFSGIFGLFYWNRKRQLIEAAKTLQDSENKFKAAFYTSPDSVNINKLDGEYVEINEGFTKLTGYTREDVIGKLSSEIKIWTKPEDRVKLIEGLQKFGVVENLESLYRAKDGTLIPGLMSAKVIYLNNEPHILSVTREIINRKKFEQEIIAAKEKAEESNRLKTAFLNNISHEFRTPMNGILGFTDLLLRPDKTEEQRKQYSEIITESCERLLDIVTDTIEISQIKSNTTVLKESECLLSEIIQEVIETTKPFIERKGLQFSFISSCDKEDLAVLIDKRKVFRILKHLIDNAIKFTNKGSIKLTCNKRDDFIDISVSDSGIGIPVEMRQLIFEPFRQIELDLSRNFGGNGVGLSIVKSYIEMLGGTINLETEVNKGSTFTITLPLKKVEKLMVGVEAKKGPVNLDNKTILIVEDEESNFLFLKELLTEKVLKTIYASNGQEALDFCKNGTEIDLVLMDIKMPIMDGYEATRLMKELRPKLPIIAQTAYALEKDVDKISNSKFDDYLAKPIKPEDLFKTITRHL